MTAPAPHPHQHHVLCLGAGYSARAFASAKPTPESVVAGTTRAPENLARLRAAGIAPLLWSDTAAVEAELARATHLVVSAAPDETGDPSLACLGAPLRDAPNLRWVGYLSTVGVYGDFGGAWVDETTPCRPLSRRSQDRLKAEERWARFGQDKGCAVAILRLSGIYGPGRNPFLNLRAGTAKRLVKPAQVFNRIHAADIAGALWHLSLADTPGVFNVTDSEPAPPQDVVSFAAGLMNVAPPPEIPFETAALTPMQRSFYGENKRVKNEKLRGTGYAFRFPDYRSALTSLWRDGTWAGDPGDRRSAINA